MGCQSQMLLQNTVSHDVDDPLKSLEEELDNLRKLDENAVQLR